MAKGEKCIKTERFGGNTQIKSSKYLAISNSQMIPVAGIEKIKY